MDTPWLSCRYNFVVKPRHSHCPSFPVIVSSLRAYWATYRASQRRGGKRRKEDEGRRSIDDNDPVDDSSLVIIRIARRKGDEKRIDREMERGERYVRERDKRCVRVLRPGSDWSTPLLTPFAPATWLDGSFILFFFPLFSFIFLLYFRHVSTSLISEER